MVGHVTLTSLNRLNQQLSLIRTIIKKVKLQFQYIYNNSYNIYFTEQLWLNCKTDQTKHVIVSLIQTLWFCLLVQPLLIYFKKMPEIILTTHNTCQCINRQPYCNLLYKCWVYFKMEELLINFLFCEILYFYILNCNKTYTFLEV